MIKDTDIDRYVSAPSLLADLCMQVVERMDADVPTEDAIPDAAAMEAQLREIAKTISRLENLSVPIPDVLRAEKTRLAAALAVKDEGTQKLEQLADALSNVLREVRMSLQRRKPPGVQAERINPERLSYSDLGDSIVRALESVGGSAPTKRVLELVEADLQEKFKPADLVWLETTKLYSWQNSASHARAKLVKRGVLRNDSPIGFWELSEAKR